MLKLFNPTPRKIELAEKIIRRASEVAGGSYYAYEEGKRLSRNPSHPNKPLAPNASPYPPPFVKTPSGRR